MSSAGGDEDGNIRAESPEKALVPAPAPASTPGKPGRPQVATLDDYKDLIVQLCVDGLTIIAITRQLNLEHGLDVSHHTVSRRLRAWGIQRKTRKLPIQDLRDRILFHYNNNLNDEQIATALKAEGYEFKVRRLARLRQKLGMKRRTRYPEYRERDYSDEEAADAPPAESTTGPEGQTSSPRAPTLKKKRNATTASTPLIPKVTAFVQQYMSKYDGSHDFNHIRRVVGLAHLIYKRLKEEAPSHAEELDLHVITLAALLHDVGDKKYLEPGQDGNTLVLATLLSFGAPEELAIKVQRIVVGVSYSSEIQDPAHVQAMIAKYPELAVVQDADRLDAIGAVGIGRTFTFGGAKGGRPMGETIRHFEEKLEKLEGMMKTIPGKALARERTDRLKTFKHWWEEEEMESREYFAGAENHNIEPYTMILTCRVEVRVCLSCVILGIVINLLLLVSLLPFVPLIECLRH
jgi:uncharacterized protein